jgi:hypothetical protein
LAWPRTSTLRPPNSSFSRALTRSAGTALVVVHLLGKRVPRDLPAASFGRHLGLASCAPWVLVDDRHVTESTALLFDLRRIIGAVLSCNEAEVSNPLMGIDEADSLGKKQEHDCKRKEVTEVPRPLPLLLYTRRSIRLYSRGVKILEKLHAKWR